MVTYAPEWKQYNKSQGCKLLNRIKMCTFLLFYLNIYIYYIKKNLHCPLEATEYNYCFPEDKISSIYP